MDVFFSVVSMTGGLAFFLFGMSILGSSLEKLSGGRMEKALEKMTSNVFKSLFLGLIVTATIQSSSATTVIVVGLVNAGILKLRNAIGVIMGANIGTTVTAIILSMAQISEGDSTNFFIRFFNPTTLAPIIAVIGIVIFMAAKKSNLKQVGEILLGFGILFNGMFIMTESVAPFSQSPFFATLFSTLSNPIFGVLAGTIVTAIIQSSSASIGILQALASTGIITYSAAIPIIMGQNIGTCVTSIISSIGANKNAKRAAMVHLYFNIIGTIIFFTLVYTIKSLIGFEFWDNKIDMAGIAAVHIMFNIGTTLIFIPFVGVLEKLAYWTIRDKKGDLENVDDTLALLDQRFIQSPSLALTKCETVVATMARYAKQNFRASVSMFTTFEAKNVDEIHATENMIDHMEDKLNNYLLALTKNELTEAENLKISYLLKLVSEYERIGDYSIDLLYGSINLYNGAGKFSKKALREFEAISLAVEEIIGLSIQAFEKNDLEATMRIEPLEEIIDAMEEKLKSKHIDRLKSGKCKIESGVIFLESLTYLERASDHCSNIAVYIIGERYEKSSLYRHEYLKKIHTGEVTSYNDYIGEYQEKYYHLIEKQEV